MPAWPFQLALILAFSAITYLAFVELPQEGPDLGWDKLNHAVAFYVLALLVDFSTPRVRFGAAKLLALMAYGVGIEAVQHFLPYREASWEDLLADAVGVLAYLLSVPLLARLPLLRARWRVGTS